MYSDTQPAPLGEASGDAWASFRVDHAREIASLLRLLRDGHVPLNVSTPDGASLATDIWSVDIEGGHLNLAADEAHPMLERVIGAEEAVAVGYLDSVKLQFDLQDLLLVRGVRSVTLQCRLPETIYRFQRRQAYRVRTLERFAPTATLRHPAIPDMQLGLRVIDVSIGGCALFLPHDVPTIEPGLRVQGVRIELDIETRFVAALSIQHVASIAADLGLRVGCEWLLLDPSAERSLQRYIDQTQKRRRLLSLG